MPAMGNRTPKLSLVERKLRELGIGQYPDTVLPQRLCQYGFRITAPESTMNYWVRWSGDADCRASV